MAIKVPNEGEIELLNKMIRVALGTDESYSFKLFINNHTPVDADTVDDYVEATFTNYSSQTLTRANWLAASTNDAGEAEIRYNAEITWTCGATGNTVWGYYVVGTTSNKLLWVERFSEAVALASGDNLTILPRFTLRSRS